jgi:Domain of unknown function (DUF4388)
MSVSGSIEHGELQTALSLVSRGRETGALVVFSAYATASIGFQDGEVVWANSTATPKLGEILVEKGLVKRDKLDAALWVQRQDKVWRPLGRVLVDVKVLAQPVAELAIEAQIVQVLEEVLRWERGTFRFEPRPPPPGEMILPACGDLGKLEIKVAMLRQKSAGVPAA